MSLRIEELKFGIVREVDGASISIKADKLTCKDEGTDYYVEVGAYINCGGLHGDTICIVSKVQIEEVEKKIVDTGTGNVTYEPYELINVTLAIVGTIEDGTFSRGISRLPIIRSDAYLLTANQVNKILGIDDNSNSKNFLVTEDNKDKAYFNLDKLLGRHTAILGTTGSGKSCTVASIIQSILKSYPYPRILFFDLHNEYPSAFGHGKEEHIDYESKTKCISWEDFSLPYWFLDLDEFIDIYYSDAGGNQISIIKDIILELKKESLDNADISSDRISVDSPIYFDILELIEKLVELKDDLTPSKQDSYIKMIHRIEGIDKDSRYKFFSRDKELKLDLVEYFKILFGLDEDEQKYLNILDLSGLPSEVRNVCIGVLSRLCFDYKYWDLDPQSLPLSLILEEAHTYIPEETSTEFSLSKKRIEKIAKEGRKYGLSLVVVTQRPSNISTTVLSQCGTYITLRLTNDNDQNKVRRLLPDTLSGQADILPSLRDGEALVSGDGIILPRKVQFRKPLPFPKSNDIEYHKSWSKEMDSAYSIEKVIRGWKLSEKQQ